MAQAAVHSVDGAIVQSPLGSRGLRAACGPVHMVGSCSRARRRMSCRAGMWRSGGGAAGGGARRFGARRLAPLGARRGGDTPSGPRSHDRPGGQDTGRSRVLGVSRASRWRHRGGQELARAIVAGQEPPLVTDPQLALGKLMDEHRTPDVMRALVIPGHRQAPPLEAHEAIVGHRARVLHREQQIHIDPNHRHKGGARLGRRDGEASIEVGHKRLRQIRVGGGVGGDPRGP